MTDDDDSPLVPREPELEVRALEHDRRVMRFATLAGPWALALVLAGLVAADRYERAHHPLPEPEIRVVMMRGAFTYAIRAQDLTPSQEGIVNLATITDYLYARESYMFGARNTLWKRVMAISAPPERTRFEDQWNNPNNPENPDKLYGTGLKAGWADLDEFSVEIVQDENSPNMFTATFRVRIVAPDGKERYVNKIAIMEWRPAKEALGDKAWRFSPLGIACWAYSSRIIPPGREAS